MEEGNFVNRKHCTKRGTFVRRKHFKNETIVTGKLFVGKQNRKERLSIKKII